MFLSRKIIYLQLQKTGCSHIAKLLSKFIGGEQIGKHNWLQKIDSNKKIIGSIRNPWDWYVSLWAYGCSKRGGFYNSTTSKNIYRAIDLLKNNLKIINGYIGPYYLPKHFFYHFLNESIQKPVDIWKVVYSDVNDPKLFQKWLYFVMDKRRKIDIGEGYWESSISNFAGLMTYRYCKLFQKNFFKREFFYGIKNYRQLVEFDEKNNILDFIIRNESLEEDLIKILESTNHIIDKKTRDIINSSSKTNISKHKNVSYYYNKKTAKIIADKEKFIIKKYNYKSPI